MLHEREREKREPFPNEQHYTHFWAKMSTKEANTEVPRNTAIHITLISAARHFR